MSYVSVQYTWKPHDLRPDRIEKFKLSEPKWRGKIPPSCASI